LGVPPHRDPLRLWSGTHCKLRAMGPVPRLTPHAKISVTTPEPTVRPPSRTAKRSP